MVIVIPVLTLIVGVCCFYLGRMDGYAKRKEEEVLEEYKREIGRNHE